LLSLLASITVCVVSTCHDANVKTAAMGGGLPYHAQGMKHRATEDSAITLALPNMTVVAREIR